MIFDAIEFAAKAHRGQLRKGIKIPYIVHPLGVAKILIEHNCTEEIIVAGILHDTVEDTSSTLEDIQKKIGKYVAQFVDGFSEPDKSDTWENRKRHTINFLETAPMDILTVACADKLDNILALAQDYTKMGEAI